MPEIAIETEQLRRTFGDFEAVAGVDLQVRRGEIYGFLGPNGAGKSTTVKVLCTLLSPSGGRASAVRAMPDSRLPGDHSSRSPTTTAIRPAISWSN